MPTTTVTGLSTVSFGAALSLQTIDKWIGNVNERMHKSADPGFKTQRFSFSGGVTNNTSSPGSGKPGRIYAEPYLPEGTPSLDFSQGEIVQSSQPTHVAINGQGTFILTDGDTNLTTRQTYYTRDGEFHVDPNGYLRSEEGLYVTDPSTYVPGPTGPFFPGAISWWDTNWNERQGITVNNYTNQTTLQPGEQIVITMDTATLVGQGDMMANANDLRILHWNSVTSAWTELDRDITNPNTASTTIAFELQAPIPPGTSIEDTYFVYYNNAGAGVPPTGVTDVFVFQDDFETGLAKWDAPSGFPGSNWQTNDVVAPSDPDATDELMQVGSNQNWWDSQWDYRTQLSFTNNEGALMPGELDSATSEGKQINITIDTQTLIAAGKMQAVAGGDINDLRVVRFDGTNWVEIPRNVNNPDDPNTVVSFELQRDLADGATNTEYYIYYGNPGAGAPPVAGFIDPVVPAFQDDFETGLAKWNPAVGDPAANWVTGDVLHGNSPASVNYTPAPDADLELLQTINTGGDTKLIAAGSSGTDYTLTVDLGNLVNGNPVGAFGDPPAFWDDDYQYIYFHHQDDNNWYRWNLRGANPGSRKLEQMVGGVLGAPLVSDAVPLGVNDQTAYSYNVQVEVIGRTFNLYQNGVLQLTYTDNSASFIPAGEFGFGNNSQSAWYDGIVLDEPLQASNGPEEFDTSETLLTAGDTSWKDYIYDLTFGDADEDNDGPPYDVGDNHFYFRYQDANNWYRVSVSDEDSEVRLEKNTNGTVTTMANEAFAYGAAPTSHTMSIQVEGADITVNIDAGVRFGGIVTDPSPITAGKIGVGNMSKSAWYDDVQVNLLNIPATVNPVDGALKYDPTLPLSEQLGLATFPNYKGLTTSTVTDTAYQDSTNSGTATFYQAGARASGLGRILDRTLEDSNAVIDNLVPELSLAKQMFESLTKVLIVNDQNFETAINLLK